MLLFSFRVSFLIVRILHCHTWTEDRTERERILPREQIFGVHIVHVPTLEMGFYPSEEEDNSLDSSIGVTAAFGSDLEGKRSTSGRNLC